MAGDAYDVIIVGGGVAGLATGALAARRGLRPLVLEQGEAPGGACATLARAGYHFDTGASLLWGLEEGGSLRTVLEEVGASLALDASPLEPGFQVAHPRHRLGVYRNEDRFWREIRREFPEGLEPLQALQAELGELDDALRRLDLPAGDLPPRTAWQRFQQWRGRSREEGDLRRRSQQLLTDLAAWQALPPELQQVLALVLRHLGQGGVSMPVLVASTVLGVARRGFTLVRGGAGRLVSALAGALARQGGTLRPMTKVTEVVLRGRRAAGVRTADGDVLEAPALVVAVAPSLLAGSLLPEGSRAFPEGVPAPEAATLTLYLGVAEAILPAEMGAQLFLGLEKPLEPAGIGTLAISASPPWDGGRAPRRRRAMTVNAYLPLGAGVLPPLDWAQVGEAVLGALDDFIPGLQGHLDFREVRSPLDWQEQTGRPLGTPGYARASLPTFLGRQGVAHRTPVPGLFVAGDWTFPGCGVAAVVEGARRTVGLLEAARR